MKLTVVRSGGFAGMTRAWETDIPRTDAEERWLPLLKNDDGAARGETGEQPGRDTFRYRITLGERTATVDEESLDRRWRELIDLARGGDR